MEWIHHISKFSPEMVTMIIAALPVSELRGAIPVAILQFKFSIWKAYLFSVIGNMIPIVPWILFLNYVQHRLMRFRVFNLFFTWLFNRTRRKGRMIERYEFIGLVLFVAIPLPVTGAWTGAVAGFLFGLRMRKSLLAILCGVLIAGTIVTVLTQLGVLGVDLFTE